MYKINFKKSAFKIFQKIPRKAQLQINKALDGLARSPFEKSGVKKVGKRYLDNLYRLRVNRWRVLYYLNTQDKTIEVNDIFMRKGKDYAKIFRMLFELL